MNATVTYRIAWNLYVFICVTKCISRQGILATSQAQAHQTYYRKNVLLLCNEYADSTIIFRSFLKFLAIIPFTHVIAICLMSNLCIFVV